MARWRVELAALALVGCLGEGRPWGEVELALGVAFEPPVARLDEALRLKTANDFRVALEAVEVDLGPVELVAQGVGAVAFDPARPPAGYSLCHNGHCHADDGGLVSYEDIAAELGGGVEAQVVLQVEGASLAAPLPGRALVETACGRAGPCEFGAPSTIGAVRVAVAAVALSGRVFEGRTGASRVPPEGLAFSVRVEAPRLSVEAGAGWEFGPGEPLGLALSATVVLPASLLDRVDWDTMAEAEVAEAVAEALREAAELAVAARRFE